MKVLKMIKKILLGIFCVIFWAFAICMAIMLLNYNKYGVTEINGKSYLLIREQMASDKYHKGDLVIVKGKKIEEINVGDEVFAYKIVGNNKVSIDLGEISQVSIQDDGVAFKNGETYAMQFIAGSAEKVYSKVGTYLSIVQSQWGFLFIILVPILLMFIYQI